MVFNPNQMPNRMGPPMFYGDQQQQPPPVIDTTQAPGAPGANPLLDALKARKMADALNGGDAIHAVDPWTALAAGLQGGLRGWAESRATTRESDAKDASQSELARILGGNDPNQIESGLLASADPTTRGYGVQAKLADLGRDTWADDPAHPGLRVNREGQFQAIPQTPEQQQSFEARQNDLTRANARNIAQMKTAADAGQPLDPESIKYAATIYRMTGQMPQVGQGKVGAAMRRAILEAASQQAIAEGTSATGDVAQHADYAGARAGLVALGHRSANIDTAAIEANKFADLSIASSRALPRGNFVPLNAASQMVQQGTSDPRLKDFVIKAQALANAAATVAGRGTPNQMLQEEYMRRLSAADGPGAFEAAAHAIVQEAKAVTASTSDVRNEMLGNIRGGGRQAPPGEAPTHTLRGRPIVVRNGGWVFQDDGTPAR